MTEVRYTEQALDQLDDLEPDIADRILNKVDEAAEWPDHCLAPLRGFPYYKLRIGDYRAIISWNRGDETLRVEAVGHRRNIYDRHLPP
ncbi:MAG: cytotoxic translational repressor of toxin-antitoxin stability system [Halonotius sp. J07HN6]|jgi:Cytotoxic translational repressor of toxin-antitoxin stability system|nr:MAG: cytotoxic translational repressor of toxin-antitoxin stability system [Halonotius sp. J07HN6]